MRGPNPDHICGLCDEFDVDQATPELAERGVGLCRVRAERGQLAAHVGCDERLCVSFRLDRPNLRRRRKFVDAHRRAQDTDQ